MRWEELTEFVYLNSHMTRAEAEKFALECLKKELTKEEVIALIRK